MTVIDGKAYTRNAMKQAKKYAEENKHLTRKQRIDEIERIQKYCEVLKAKGQVNTHDQRRLIHWLMNSKSKKNIGIITMYEGLRDKGEIRYSMITFANSIRKCKHVEVYKDFCHIPKMLELQRHNERIHCCADCIQEALSM